MENGVCGLVHLDWDVGKQVGKIALGDSPIFNTTGGFLVPLNERQICLTSVFSPVLISKAQQPSRKAALFACETAWKPDYLKIIQRAQEVNKHVLTTGYRLHLEDVMSPVNRNYTVCTAFRYATLPVSWRPVYVHVEA